MNSPMSGTSSSDQSEFVANLNIFRQIDFFSGVPIEVMKLFAFLCKRQSYKTGDTIFKQGDDDGCSYFILSGSAELIYTDKDMDHVIRKYGEESYFGVLSLITPIVKQFSLNAVSDTTCLVMTRKAFTKVVDQFPDTPLKIARSIAQKLVQAEKKCIMAYELNKQEELKDFMGISLV